MMKEVNKDEYSEFEERKEDLKENGEGSPKMKRSIIAPYNPDEKIHVADPEKVKRKIEKMRRDGRKKLNVYSDYDFTLTKRKIDEQWADSTFKVLASSVLLSEKYKTTSKNLFDVYSVFEKDEHLSAEKRTQKMEEWWEKTLELIIAEKLTKKKIKACVLLSDLYFRYGIVDVFDMLEEGKIPLFIVSAGLTSIIKQSFNILDFQTSLNTTQVLSLCSTAEEYDETEQIIKFYKPYITSTNKFMVLNHERFPTIEPKSNGILIGDLIQDKWMINNINLSECLTIGMLNSKDPSELALFMKEYDIVIEGDGNLVHVARIIAHVAGLSFSDYEKFGENGREIEKLFS